MNDKPGWEAQYQIDTLRADLAKAQAESEAAAKRWDEENASLAAQLAKAQARCAEMAAALTSIRDQLQGTHDAVCVPTWTAYGRHEPNADCDLVDVASAALASDGTSALAAVRLAQRLTRLLCRGGNLYDLPEQVEAALAEAFGGGE